MVVAVIVVVLIHLDLVLVLDVSRYPSGVLAIRREVRSGKEVFFFFLWRGLLIYLVSSSVWSWLGSCRKV